MQAGIWNLEAQTDSWALIDMDTVMYRQLVHSKPATLRKKTTSDCFHRLYSDLRWNVCVCLQGGYATYRYAQPAAATAAAYSDR